jgi:hypothetical protein
LRLDADVTDLVGFAQPANCSTITGVVANYFATQQLLPRMRTDFPCANKYQQTGDDLQLLTKRLISQLECCLVWNETNSPAAGKPNSDAIQKKLLKMFYNN